MYAQRNNPAFTVSSSSTPYHGEALNVFDLREKELEGEEFWFEEWMPGVAILNDSQVVEDYPLRYNIQSHMVEIQTARDIKILPASEVKLLLFNLPDNPCYFVNLPTYLEIPPYQTSSGLSRVLYEGTYQIFQRKEGELLPANYTPALDAGNINEKIIFKDVFYLYDGRSLERLPGSRRKLIRFLADKGIEAEGFIKSEKINPKKLEDLVRLFEYVES